MSNGTNGATQSVVSFADPNAPKANRTLSFYGAALVPVQVATNANVPPADFTNSNWHMFQVVLPEEKLTVPRAGIMAKLHAAGIGNQVHYPAIHLFAVYRRLGWKPGDFPHAEYAGRNILTLPLFPTMTDEDVVRVTTQLTALLKQHRKS